MEQNKFFNPNEVLYGLDSSFDQDYQCEFTMDGFAFTEENIDRTITTAQKIKALKFVYELNNLTDIEWT